MHGLDDATIAKACDFFAVFSTYYKTEADTQNLQYLEVSDTDFTKSLKSAASALLAQ
jgi:hypothetical protein